MIKFENVSKTYSGGVEAVKNLSLSVEEGETLVLLGTSGCGKATTLKMVNRLVEPSSGYITVQGENIMEQDPISLRRGIGYSIQHIGLFPHMTVGQNVGVVPRLLDWPRDRIESRVEKLLEMMTLPPAQFKDRYPAQLSGGQRQRVGVARALGADPPVILMDEPFGALDPITREQLQNEFLELQAELKKTILFVTHDVFEAVKMGDRIALLDRGELQQLDTPAELVESPANQFVDDFLGQHRFQLSLLTRTVEDIVSREEEGEPESKPEDFLTLQSSLVNALDAFKRCGAQRLPIFRGDRRVGELHRQAVLDLITETLEETGAEA